MKRDEISKGAALARLLRTFKGERVMKPDYGIAWYKYLDRESDSLLLKAEIVSAINRYEKRVLVERINLKHSTDGNLEVEIKERGYESAYRYNI